MNAIARKPEVGARTLVYGICAPLAEHGAYLPDCKATAVKGLAGEDKTEAREVRDWVWAELKGILEGVRKGVTELGGA